MPDPVLSNPSGTGPLPGGDADSPLLPGSGTPPDVPASGVEVQDPSPADPPLIEGGAEPA